MKVNKTLYILLLLLPLVITLAALPYLPDQVPGHYNIHNQVDRWGSKYEMLITPAITIVFGLGMLPIARLAGKQEGEGENNYKITLFTSMLCMGLFTAMTLYFLYAAFTRTQDLDTLEVSMDSLLWLLMGGFLILSGNIMPKAKKNSFLGLRTTWSMSSDVAWKKSQRFGGISAILCGAAMILVSLVLRGMLCTLLCLMLLVAMVVLDVVYSYHAAKNP